MRWGIVVALAILGSVAVVAAGGATADPGKYEVNLTDGSGDVTATYHYNGSAVIVEYANGTTESTELTNENESALTIDWAVANSTATYDTVSIGPGTYNGTVDVETSDRTIEGMGPSETQLTGLAGSQTGIRIAGTGTTVSSLRIEEYGGGLTVGETGIVVVADDASVKDVEIASTGAGIEIDGASMLVDNATLTANRRSGISITSGATDTTITNTEFDGNAVYGLQDRGEGTSLRNSSLEGSNDGIRITESATNTTIWNNSLQANTYRGITVRGSHVVVNGNTVTNQQFTGIWTRQASVNVSISHNEITDTGGSGPGSTSTGILLRGDGHDLSDNGVWTSEDYGIHVDGADNVTMENDTVADSGTHGIRLAPSNGTTLHNVSSTDNGGSGLVLSDSDDVEFHGGNLSSNADNGTTVSNANDFVLTDSTVQDNGVHGVRFVSDVDSSLIRDSAIHNHSTGIAFGILGNPLVGSDNRIVNNSLLSDEAILLHGASNTSVLGNNASGGGRSGLYADNSPGLLFRNNTFMDFESGIETTFGSDGVTIRNNEFVNTTFGIDVGSVDNATVESNIVPSGGTGIALYNTRHAVLRSNKVAGTLTGLDLQDTLNTTVLNHTLGDHLYQAVMVRRSTGPTFRNVTIEDDFAPGFDIAETSSNVTVVDSMVSVIDTNIIARGDGHEFRNVTLDGDETGFLVEGSDISIHDAMVVNNTVGLAASNASDLTVSGGTWSGGETGMRVSESNNTTVSSAVVEGANQSGIRIESSGNVTVQDTTVRDNAAGGSYFPYDGGIVVNNSVDVSLDGNVLQNNSRYGIVVTEESRNVAIRNTRIIDNPNYGVDTNTPTTFRNVTAARNGFAGFDLLEGSTLVNVVAEENEGRGIVVTSNATLRNVVSRNNSEEDVSFGNGVSNASNVTASSIPFASVNGRFWSINDTAGTVPATPSGTVTASEAFNITGLTSVIAFGDAVIDYGALDTTGIAESSLSLYRLNVSAGSWESVSGGSVDAGADEYSIDFASGDNGTYRLLGQPGGGGPIPPPSGGGGGGSTGGSPVFTIADRTLDGTEVGLGEPVTVSVRVENIGMASGTHTVELTHEGEVLDSGSVEVSQNDAETLELETSFDSPGSYELAAGGESVGTVTVVGEASLAITDVSLNRTAVDSGATVSITATVENTGAGEGEMTVPLTVAGEEVATETVSVAPGESATVTFAHTFTDGGSQSISVAGQEAGTVEVTPSTDGGISPVIIGVVGVLLVGGGLGAYYFREEIGETLEDLQS